MKPATWLSLGRWGLRRIRVAGSEAHARGRPARLYPEQEAADNDDYCPYGKPAGAFMAARYRAWSEEHSR